jgi:hypothetical protein
MSKVLITHAQWKSIMKKKLLLNIMKKKHSQNGITFKMVPTGQIFTQIVVIIIKLPSIC